MTGSDLGRARWLLLALALGLAACGPEETETEAKPRPVRVVTVEEAAGGTEVSIAGTIEANEQADIGFRIGGRLVERLVNVGDVVAPGQEIARLDAGDEENSLRAAEANLAAANGQLSEARVNYDRQRQLYQRQIAARAAFERAEQVFTTAAAAADAAQAQVSIARRRLDDTVLLADAAGVVTAIGAETGEVVPAGRMIVQVARDNGLDAVLNVPAAILEASTPDPEVTVTLSINPRVTAQGRVREVAPRADPVTGTFRIRVGLIDPPAEMRLGSTVVALAHFGGEGGIEIPATALTRADGEPAVWVVDPASNTVSLRGIGIDRFSPSSVRVADGLQVGDIVVTAGVQVLRPGQEVRLPGNPS